MQVRTRRESRQAPVLLIEDDASVRRTILRFLPNIDVATTWDEGHEKVERCAYAGMIADIRLPGPIERTGLDHAERAYELYGTRIMILSAHATDEYRARGSRIRALYCLKPFSPWILVAFHDSCLGSSHVLVDDNLQAALHVWVVRYALTTAEAAILVLRVQRYDNDAIAIVRHTSVKTIENQISALLEKVGDDNLWAAALRLSEEARLLRTRR